MAYSEITDRFIIPKDELIIWRYMDYDKFEYMIKKSALYFARADEFGKYDEAVISFADKEFLRKGREQTGNKNWESDYQNEITFYEATKTKTYLSCWIHSHNETRYMWNNFTKTNEAIAIKTKVGNFKKVLIDTNFKEGIQIGKVEYTDPISSTIGIFNIARLYFRKITDFRNENEIRAIILLHSHEEGPHHLDVSINLNDLIDEIYLNPSSDFSFENKIKNLLKEFNVNKEIFQSKISDYHFTQTI